MGGACEVLSRTWIGTFSRESGAGGSSDKDGYLLSVVEVLLLVELQWSRREILVMTITRLRDKNESSSFTRTMEVFYCHINESEGVVAQGHFG